MFASAIIHMGTRNFIPRGGFVREIRRTRDLPEFLYDRKRGSSQVKLDLLQPRGYRPHLSVGSNLGFAPCFLRSLWGPIGVRSGYKTYKNDLTPTNFWQDYNPMENQLIALI